MCVFFCFDTCFLMTIELSYTRETSVFGGISFALRGSGGGKGKKTINIKFIQAITIFHNEKNIGSI